MVRIKKTCICGQVVNEIVEKGTYIFCPKCKHLLTDGFDYEDLEEINMEGKKVKITHLTFFNNQDSNKIKDSIKKNRNYRNS